MLGSRDESLIESRWSVPITNGETLWRGAQDRRGEVSTMKSWFGNDYRRKNRELGRSKNDKNGRSKVRKKEQVSMNVIKGKAGNDFVHR